MAQQQISIDAVRLAIAMTAAAIVGNGDSRDLSLLPRPEFATVAPWDMALALGAIAAEGMMIAASLIEDSGGTLPGPLTGILSALAEGAGMSVGVSADLRGVDAVTMLREIARTFEAREET